MNTVPSPFESFNARALAAEKVAESFIPSERFEELATRTHSLVVGPRGSGKTSLLKMLQTRALETWPHPDAASFRAKVDYTGVFVATDIAWQDQLENLGFKHLTRSEKERLCIAAFSFHVFHALINAFLNRLDRTHPGGDAARHRRVNLSDENETALVRELAEASLLKPAVNSLQSLKHAALRRISDIWKIAMDEALRPEEGRAARMAALGFLNIHFLKLTAFAVEVFNDAVGDPDGRWALLFDELEIAPRFILQELLTSFRSIDERLIIKISLSPYSAELDSFRASLRAMPGQDYGEIRLWYAHKEEGYDFGRRLIEALLKTENLNVDRLEDIFGDSPFEKDAQTAYRPGSVQYRTIEEALRVDPSFRKYFEERKLSLGALSQMTGHERAVTVRKIYPTLLLRRFFRTFDDNDHLKRQEQRSRKNPSIYGGATGILAMAEGNPRWLIGITRGILRRLKRREPNQPPKKVPLQAQTDEALKAAHRFRALLKLIPVAENGSDGEPRSVLNILDKVGRYFHNSVVLAPFKPQPYGSFIVDSTTSESVLRALGLALNAGAIVFVPDVRGEVMVGSLKGKRFRLCYLLSPVFEIPIRLGDSVALSRILDQSFRSETPSSLTSAQGELL